ncbi:MAG: hypothetical protein QM743_06890 [Chitinophagaceae bacterium]
MKQIYPAVCSLLLALTLSFHAGAQSYPSIDKAALTSLISQDKEHQYFAVFIFTNDCGGGMYMADLRKQIDSITNGRTKFIFAQASRGKDRNAELEAAIKTFRVDKDEVYLINDATYKTDRKDAREQGMLFRNEVCFDCKFMEIGTVYKLIFDREQNLLYHGLSTDKKQLAAILRCK